MEYRNGSSPASVVSQEMFDQLNLLAERFALLAEMAMLHLRGEVTPDSHSYAPFTVADELDHLCDALNHFRETNGVAIPDLDSDTELAE